MESLALDMTINTLKKVTTFDVNSWGTQSYYQQLTRCVGEVYHCYSDAGSIIGPNLVEDGDTSEISVGYIGSIYDKKDLFVF